MSDYHITAVTSALRRLGGTSLLPPTVAHLHRHAAEIHAELIATVLAEIPAFSESRDQATGATAGHPAGWLR